MQVNFTGNTSGLVSAVGGAKNALASLASSPTGAIVAGVAAIGAAAVGVAVKSVQMASQYEQAMNMVKALTGSNTQQMAQYDAGVKKLAVDAGVAPTALASGLYNVLSASYKGAEAMNILTLATEDSKIGMTSAAVTSDALTNVLRTFSVQAGDVTRVNGEMLQTVTLGKATFEQYATTIVKSASAASQFHISMETMNAAWSTMTSSGIRAAQASTDFQQSLKVMYGNIGTVTKSLEKNGIAFDENKFNAMSYGDKVVYLNAALQKANEMHVKVTGVTLQAAQAVQTIAKHIDDYNSNLAKLSDKQAMAQKTQEAWAITQGGFAQTMSRVKAALDVVLIDIGQALLPVLTKLASAALPIINGFAKMITSGNGLGGAMSGLGTIFSNVWKYLQGDQFQGFIADCQTLGNQLMNVIGPALSHLAPLVQGGLGLLGAILTNVVIPAIDNVVFGISSFITLVQQNQVVADLLVAALVGIGVAIGVAVIPGLVAAGIAAVVSFGAWAVAAGAAAIATLAVAAPFILIGLVVAAVVFGIIMAIQHWGQITTWLKGVWSAIAGWFGNLFSGIGSKVHDLVTNIGNMFSGLGSTVHDKLTGAKNAVGGFFSDLGSKAQSAWQGLQQGAQNGANGVVTAMKWMYDHNTYVKNLVDFVKTQFTEGVKFWQSKWSDFTSWLGDTWNKISSLATTVFTAILNFFQRIWTSITNWINQKWLFISSLAKILWGQVYTAIQDKLNQVNTFLTNILTNILVFIMEKWNTVITYTTNLWNKISSIFGNAWNTYIGAPLNNLWASITGWFNKALQGFLNFGGQIMQAIANGISGAAGFVGNAIHGAISNALSALGFHGIPGFASGVTNFGGGWAVVGERGPELMYLPQGTNVYPNGAGPNGGGNSPSVSSASNNGGQQDIYIMLDSQTLAHAVSSKQARIVRLRQGRRAA